MRTYRTETAKRNRKTKTYRRKLIIIIYNVYDDIVWRISKYSSCPKKKTGG